MTELVPLNQYHKPIRACRDCPKCRQQRLNEELVRGCKDGYKIRDLDGPMPCETKKEIEMKTKKRYVIQSIENNWRIIDTVSGMIMCQGYYRPSAIKIAALLNADCKPVEK
jgi:hypothetical protein